MFLLRKHGLVVDEGKYEDGSESEASRILSYPNLILRITDAITVVFSPQLSTLFLPWRCCPGSKLSSSLYGVIQISTRFGSKICKNFLLSIDTCAIPIFNCRFMKRHRLQHPSRSFKNPYTNI